MNVRFLETFVCVAQTRSFSAAAVRLNATQAAVSNRIATLERDLDTRLFDRGKREISLTPSGRKLLDLASCIVRLAGEFKSVLTSDVSARSISIGATETIAQLWLPMFLRRFEAAHADVNVDLVVDSMPRLTRLLEQGDIDLALVIDPIAEPNVVVVGSGWLDCRWFASTSCHLPQGCVSLEHLVGEGLIIFPHTLSPSASLHQLLAKHRIDRDAVRIVPCDSVGAMVKLVREGLGVACLPELLVADYIADGQLRWINAEDVLAPIHFKTVIPTTGRHPLAQDAVALAISVVGDFCGEKALCARNLRIRPTPQQQPRAMTLVG